ncbi:acetyl-CoA C-acyltransferase [Nocardia sp. 348MFTsu5.1]|uniref:thiolase family protein n=1 Tax=Nocardia sp. 348MFTsu5.1 TaxID=1172185 RepID=UPI0003A4E277|nr:acetyl-CoA C-acyltransferase [Nocardia sp. 348MFTsu5.1]
MRDAVIVEAVRTGVARRNGSLAGLHPVDVSALVLQALVGRAGLEPAVVDDVVWGCVSQIGDQGGNLGRNAVLAAGWPESVPATTVDRQCGSSQQAVHFAAAGVVSGQYDVAVAGGAESMTRVPMGSPVTSGHGFPMSDRLSARYQAAFNQGIGAEMIAENWGLTRTQLDEYALESHERAAAARDDGASVSQIVSVDGATQFNVDECIRVGTTMEKMSQLKSAFKDDGLITAGNSSQIADGAGALLVTTSEKAAELGLTPIVRVHTSVVVGSDPVMMLTGPIPATAKVLAKSGLQLSDIGAFEVNEAFASVPLAWMAETGADPKLVNPLGGAIAVGHPLGGSGAVLMTRLINHMRDNGIRYGMQTMCEGGGMANATILELL